MSKGEKGRRQRAERRPKTVERMGGGLSEFLYPPPSRPVAPPCVLNAPRLSGCCFDSWTISVCC